MSFYRLPQNLLSGLLLAGVPFLCHAQSTSGSASVTAATSSAIVGVTATQNARLNVLNLQPMIPGVTAVACPATLEFYDESGALLKQLAVPTIPPGAAVNLIFKPPVPTATANSRAEIRAAVAQTNLVTPVANSGAATILPAGPICNFMSSLEITDDATGTTQILTTDFRAQPRVVQPAAN